ncbi:MAG: metalloregulator ArsR/SmtB family transcription factor [Patescibacteria group bacterium]
MKQTEKILKALANQRRLEIVRLLKKRRQATVGEIAEAIDLSFRATSRHLGVLRSAEILDKKQQSLQVWYFISDQSSSIAKAVIHLI